MSPVIIVTAIMICAPLVIISEDIEAQPIRQGGEGLTFEATNLTIDDMLRLDREFGEDAEDDVMESLGFSKTFRDSVVYSGTVITDISYTASESNMIGAEVFGETEVEIVKYNIRFTAVVGRDCIMISGLGNDIATFMNGFNGNKVFAGDRFEIEATYELLSSDRTVSTYVLNNADEMVVTSVTEESREIENVIDARIVYTPVSTGVAMTLNADSHYDSYEKELESYDFLGADMGKVTESTITELTERVTDGWLLRDCTYSVESGESAAYIVDVSGQDFLNLPSSAPKIEREHAEIEDDRVCEIVTSSDLFDDSAFGNEAALYDFMRQIGSVNDDYTYADMIFNGSVSTGGGSGDSDGLIVGAGVTAGVVAVAIGGAALMLRRP